MALGFVYVLSNPAMPGLIKIGCTAADEVAARVTQLYSSGVPFPFTVEFAARVGDPERVEAALHEAFAPNRVNPRREFFQVEAAQAIAILKLLHVDDATSEVEAATAAAAGEDAAAAEQYRAKRPPLNFTEMGIPVGSTLQFTRGDLAATVSGPKKVIFQGTEMSLTAATRQCLGVDYNVAPGGFWTYNGKSIAEFYEETYQRE